MSEDPFHFKHLAFLSLYSPFQKEKKRKEGRLNPGRCRYTRPLRSAGSLGPFNLNLRDSPGPAGPGSVPGWELRSHMPCGTANKHKTKPPKPEGPVRKRSRETWGQEQGSKSGGLCQKQRGFFHARAFRRQDRRTALRPQRLSPLSCLPHCVPRTPDPIKSTSWLPYPAL